jgi:hypothetical protein
LIISSFPFFDLVVQYTHPLEDGFLIGPTFYENEPDKTVRESKGEAAETRVKRGLNPKRGEA